MQTDQCISRRCTPAPLPRMGMPQQRTCPSRAMLTPLSVDTIAPGTEYEAPDEPAVGSVRAARGHTPGFGSKVRARPSEILSEHSSTGNVVPVPHITPIALDALDSSEKKSSL